MMRFSRLLFVVAYLVSILVCLASSKDESHLFDTCLGANYTSNSIYQNNLNTLLSSLSSNNDINYGFYNFSAGEGIDRVNAIALCRGDISQTACRRCVNFSTTDLPKSAPGPDLTEVQCSDCLRSSFGHINQAFPGKRGGRVIGPSCNFRYEINQFYAIPSPPSLPASPPPAFAPPPPTATETVPQTGKLLPPKF
ncbi:hypothetical protein QQ045_002170 [Rhodiola kirilowii]